jgi:hypothetical protein
MSNFKAGDLALIKYGDAAGELVELVSRHTTDGEVVRGVADTFVADGGVQWLVSWVHEGAEGLYDEHWLMPLRGDFQPEQQKSREVPA